MTMTHYPNGYGRRDPVPECITPVTQVDCPCCEGNGAHSYGAGMDADSIDCSTCNGFGYLLTSVPAKTNAWPQR